ncbi:MAG: PAS domain-containing protein [Microthrixaceae bacterium]
MQASSHSRALPVNAVEALSEGVALVSATGTIEFVNSALCQMLGLSADDVVGQNTYSPPWGLESPSVGMLPPPSACARPAVAPAELTLLLHARGPAAG